MERFHSANDNQVESTSKDVADKKTLVELLKELDADMANTKTKIQKYDSEIKTLKPQLETARDAAAKKRWERQSIPINLMTIDGKDANGGGMSLPGQGVHEALGSGCKCFNLALDPSAHIILKPKSQPMKILIILLMANHLVVLWMIYFCACQVNQISDVYALIATCNTLFDYVSSCDSKILQCSRSETPLTHHHLSDRDMRKASG